MGFTDAPTGHRTHRWVVGLVGVVGENPFLVDKLCKPPKSIAISTICRAKG